MSEMQMVDIILQNLFLKQEWQLVDLMVFYLTIMVTITIIKIDLLTHISVNI